MKRQTVNRDDLKIAQAKEREKYLQAILKSSAPKKIIVAGPGTGKTFTFGKVLELNVEGNNIAMTFIRKLAQDLETSLGHMSEVKTFHAYCKKILHEQNGRVNLVPYLTSLIKKDAEILGKNLTHFDAKFQSLDEDSPEVEFYLERGDYYEVVAFNDAVYRLYKQLQDSSDVLPNFDQILIDEFQDFNPLEVAFIDELEKKGPILIVGDDDQAIFDERCASPNYLREKTKSGEYEIYELPFCSRCPKVIVDATNSIIVKSKQSGNLKDRITKRYDCYIADKEEDSKKYSKIITAHCTNAQSVATYVRNAISRIDATDITESWSEGKEYPTVLVVGEKQYLSKVAKVLRKDYTNLKYAKPELNEYGVIDGYREILRIPDSNLGWRILAEIFLNTKDFERILHATVDGTPMIDILDDNFLNTHRRVIEILRVILNEDSVTKKQKSEMRILIGEYSNEVVENLLVKTEDEPEIDKTQPSILLTSFKGCKGLSAVHVFIVGANNGSIPKNPHNLRDIEICQFIVALTRTRKQCHIISNKWLYNPKYPNGRWRPQMERSILLDFIPDDFIQDLGDLNAEKIREIFNE